MLASERDRAEITMSSLRWLALLLSIVLLLQCIGSCLPSPLHRLERFAGNDLQAHFDVLVSMPSASVKVALFVQLVQVSSVSNVRKRLPSCNMMAPGRGPFPYRSIAATSEQ